MGTTGVDEAESTSPDMLKNSPSNIRRLANEIEQCEGRQKYLAHTRSPSDSGDFRWYFCKIPLGVNELAASIPRTEVIGKGEYFRFGIRDSLAIEASFLQREEELLSSWWKEYAECSEGPRGQRCTSSELSQKNSSESPESCQLLTTDVERVGVPVKGGLYEVDLVRRQSFPVYWNGENRRVLRGHWFARKGGLDWLPLREDVSEQLEYAYRAQVWHRRTFQPSGLFAARVDLQGSTSGLHALFTGEDDTWEAWLSGISSIVRLGNNGIKLRRGYAPSQSKKPTQDELRQQKEEEMDDYCSQVPVRHLVFMVHGIGQRLEKSNLVDDVGCFRQLTASIAEKHLTSHQRGTQRVLYIPCQWRKGLTLSGEAVVEKITLDGVRGLRTMLSGTVHDVLYYMSPIHCQDIIDSVSIQLNKLYLKFLKRNPGYDGKVSLYGHSLGSVLSYDILCHQENLYSPFPMEWMYRQQKESKSSQKESKSSNCNPTLGVEDESSENSGCESIVSHADNSSLVEEHVERVFNQVGPPASSDSDESTSVDTGYEQTNDALASVENPTETPSISDIKEYYESEVNDSNSMKSEIIPFDDNPSGNDVADYERTSDAVASVENPTETPSISDNREYYESEVNDSNSMKSEIIPFDDNPSGKDVADHERTSDAVASVENPTETPSILNNREHCDSEIMTCDDNPSGKDVADNDEDEIIKSLMEEIDLLKSKIKEFEGASSGRVSTTPVNGPEPRSVLEHTDSLKCYTPQIRYTKLEFKVDTFFAVGAPLGVFLSLRNVRIGIGRGKGYWKEENIKEEMPACRQMFNIFHPFDPVAYRIEPLVCKEYLHTRPVIVPYHRGGKRLYIGFQEFKEGIAARSQSFMDHLSTIKVKVLTICESRSNDCDDEESENTQEKEERTYGSIMMKTLTGSEDGRIDHVLQDKTFRHPYVSAIGAHTNYWRDPDTALFMLKHLYRDIPEQLGSNMKEDDQNKLSDPRVIDDEHIPLTFSDTVFVKHFAYTAKKVMKDSDEL